MEIPALPTGSVKAKCVLDPLISEKEGKEKEKKKDTTLHSLKM